MINVCSDRYFKAMENILVITYMYSGTYLKEISSLKKRQNTLSNDQVVRELTKGMNDTAYLLQGHDVTTLVAADILARVILHHFLDEAQQVFLVHARRSVHVSVHLNRQQSTGKQTTR